MSGIRPAHISDLREGAVVLYKGHGGLRLAVEGEIVGDGTECDRPVWDVDLGGGRVRWGFQEQFLIEEKV